MDLNLKQVLISNPDPKEAHESAPRSFTFDLIFDWNSKQVDVFNSCALPIVNSVLEGYNGTIFAYGQTGTGKTHTMEGKTEPKDLMGIIPRSFEHIFEQIDNLSHKQFLVRVQMLEI
jgi:kinesin family protein 3/17